MTGGQPDQLIIDLVALAKQGDKALGSVRPVFRLAVCLCVLSCLNRFTYTLPLLVS